MENTHIYNLYGDPVSDRRLTYVSRYLDRFSSDNITFFTCLDLGCGPWEYVPLLTKRNMHIIGFDISSEYLKTARSRITTDYERVDLIRGDLAHLPFKNGVFDLIICLSVLEHLNSPEKLVHKIKFLLNEGGL